MPFWSLAEECMEPEERVQRQLERLQSTLNRACRNVPFYRNLFQEMDVDPGQVQSLEDLQTIPFTERAHFSENYPYGLFAVPLRDVVRIHSARGTELKPIVSGYTKGDLQAWRGMVARALTAAGVTGNDILQIELDPGLTNWGRDYKDGAEAIEASVIPLNLLPLQKGVMILRDYRTTVLVISPSAAIQLADYLFRANLNPNALALRTLILVGEPPDSRVISQLESQLHVRAWVQYGLSDVPGPAVAFECEEREGLHVNEDHFLPEVINPQTGELIPDGEEGELILTTLSTRAFPLIRFRTGDRMRLLPGTCACGRTLRRMEWSLQRVDDMRVVRGVKLHHDQILLLLQRALGFTPVAYRFLIKRENLQDGLEVWLQVDEKLFSDEIKGMEQLSLRLGTDLAQELGLPVTIRFKEPLSMGDPAAVQVLEDFRHEATPG